MKNIYHYDNEQKTFANKLRITEKVIKSTEKKLFRIIFTTREKVFKNFKNELFPVKRLELKLEVELEPEPKLKCRKFSLKQVNNF